MTTLLDPGRAWILALLVMAVACAWAVLLLQALFHDRRIAIVGLIGAVSASLLTVVSGRLATAVLLVVGVANAAFLVWFIVRHWRRPFVYLPIAVLIVAAAAGGWMYLQVTDEMHDTAGATDNNS